MPPTVPTQDFRTLLGRLIPALTAAGPDAPEVVALVQLAKQQFPDRTGQIDSIVAAWREMTAAPGAPSVPPPDTTPPTPAPTDSTLGSLLSHGGTLTLGAVIVFVLSNWATIKPYLDSMTENPARLGLLLVVAAGGVLGSLLNAYAAGNIGILPHTIQLGAVSFQGLGKIQTVSVPGLLVKLLTGLAGAVVAVWLPLWTQGTDSPSTTLYASSFVGALGVGLFGSQALSGFRDKNLLMAALQQALASPRNEVLAQQVGNATSVLQAVEMVTGKKLTSGSVPQVFDVATAQAELLGLLDPDTLRTTLTTLGQADKPAALTRDLAGLEMRILRAVKNATPQLPSEVQHMKIARVANMTLDNFRTSVNAFVDGSPAQQKAADDAYKAAKAFMEKLGQMPSNWQFTPSVGG